jgi:hypothetical protein
MSKITPNMIAMLIEPLPPEAIKPHPTKPYLSSINAMYVIQRINTVFGIGSWKMNIEVLDSSAKMVTVKVKFSIPQYDIELEQFGGNDNTDKGDALKGATTDALTKIGSYLGIGQDVWLDTQHKTTFTSPTPVQQNTQYNKRKNATDEDMLELLSRATKVKLTSGQMKTGRMWYAGDNFWLTREQFQEITDQAKLDTPLSETVPPPEFPPQNNENKFDIF